MTTQNLIVHILRDGPSRNTMIKKIVERLNGDEGVLADGWENLPTEDLLELYNTFAEDLD